MNTILEEIDQIQKEIDEKQEALRRLKILSETFPDLEKHVNRWKKVRYCSPSVNSKTTRFEIKHNCGCCSDSPLEVWPYVETEHGKVYSKPPVFQVGEQHWIAGDTPFEGWKGKLRSANIPEDIIGAVSQHFKESAEQRRRIAENADYDEEDD